MTKISRRDFLRLVALGMGGVAMNRFLAACSTDTPTSPPWKGHFNQ